MTQMTHLKSAARLWVDLYMHGLGLMATAKHRPQGYRMAAAGRLGHCPSRKHLQPCAAGIRAALLRYKHHAA